MSGGGGSTTTSSTTVPPQFLQAYQQTVNRATQVASAPYQGYNGQLVAGFSGDQTAAQQAVRNVQGSYQPMLNNATSAVQASQTPLWQNTQQFSPSAVQQYENPYQSQVVAATQAQIANQDAQQQTQLAGNAASSGAFGGDRMGVAQGVLGGQQALANNSTLAGLNQSNYNQALGEFNQQQGAQLGANEANSWLNSQAGYAYGNLASEGNNLALTNASALAQSGATQQQQQQAGLNTQYEQWQAQQAFPYQQTGWLANITEGIGSNVGGTSTTTSSNRGGRIGRAPGGIIPYDPNMLDFGGANSQNGGILSEIPNVSGTYIPAGSGGGSGSVGRGPPSAPNAPLQSPGPFANPVTDIGAASSGYTLYKGTGAQAYVNGLMGGSSPTVPASADAGSFGQGATSTLPSGWGSSAATPAAGSWGAQGATDASMQAAYPGWGASASTPAAGSWGAQGGIAGQSAFDASTQAAGTQAVQAATANAGAAQAGTNAGIASTIQGANAAPASSLGFDAATQAAGTQAVQAATANAGAVQAGTNAGIASTLQGANATGTAAGLSAADTAATTTAASTGATLGNTAAATAAADAATTGATAAGAGAAGTAAATGAAAAGTAAAGTAAASAAAAAGTTAAGTAAATAAASAAADAAAADSASYLMALALLKDGGRVGENRQQHNRGGIVVPFHRATGGKAGNSGEMPYTMAPPVSLANGTTGVPVAMSYLPGQPGTAQPQMTQGMSQGSGPSGQSGGGPMVGNMFRRGGGIVVPFRHHFDDGGTLTPDNNQFGGAGVSDPSWDTKPAQSAGIAQSQPAPAPNATGTYTPEKPNLWIPALTALATAGLNRHGQVGKNISEGVLAGLNSYGSENQRYQEGQQKAASIEQEAKRLADDAQFHKDQIGIENARANTDSQHYAAMENIDTQRNQNEAAHNAGALDVERQRVGVEQASQQSMDAWRRSMMGGIGSLVGTTSDGKPVFVNPKFGNGAFTEDGQPYSGPLGPMPAAAVAHQDRVAKMSQQGSQFGDTYAANYADRLRKLTDTIYTGAATNGHAITAQAARETAIAQMKFLDPKAGQASDGSTTPEANPLLQNPSLGGVARTPQPPAQEFFEGQTATNPQTGARMVFRGGQWQPQ